MLLCYILGLLVMALLCWLVSLIYRAFPGLADLNWVASMIPPFFLMLPFSDFLSTDPHPAPLSPLSPLYDKPHPGSFPCIKSYCSLARIIE